MLYAICGDSTDKPSRAMCRGAGEGLRLTDEREGVVARLSMLDMLSILMTVDILVSLCQNTDRYTIYARRKGACRRESVDEAGEALLRSGCW